MLQKTFTKVSREHRIRGASLFLFWVDAISQSGSGELSDITVYK
jgi:hypothetical protein